MQLNTPSSLLRPWSLDDTESLTRHANNPHIARCMRDGFPNPYTHADAARFISMATGDNPHIFLAIVVQGEAVGGIGIHVGSDVYHHTAEIGYWISEYYQGKGIITDAVRIMVPFIFRTRDIIRIQAGVFGNNPASMKVLEKCGFSLEAIHKKSIIKRGEILDEYLYVIFRDEILIHMSSVKKLHVQDISQVDQEFLTWTTKSIY